MEGESTEIDKESTQIELQQAQDRIQALEEQIHQKDEQTRIAEQKMRDSEQKLRDAELKLRDEQEQKRQALEQVRTKETDLQRLQTEITKLRNIPVLIPQIPLVAGSTQEDKKSQLSNPDTTGEYIRLERIDRLNRKAVALQYNQYIVIPLNKEISKGIHSVSAKFEKSNLIGFANVFVGIAKATHIITCPCDPAVVQNNKIMLFYHGHYGNVWLKGIQTPGNDQFSDGQLIAMELNADVGTLHFFVDGTQQRVFVRGIKEAVKFYWFLFAKDSSVAIVSVKQLSSPTVKKLENEKAIDW
ncbi:MAG: hypothetical protein EZS28_037951 [Streblomastix strix]|uniref:B30.2/SPRY domain-containing protein n=1 Tax=Streblomastix strix TaxID=222440 RepID=A0A5J4U9F1_9EUKA|nr:MAG: hypothetical protein EZS28_037951 [Streblomastix strix]